MCLVHKAPTCRCMVRDPCGQARRHRCRIRTRCPRLDLRRAGVTGTDLQGTNAVLDEVREWQARPLDRVHAAIYLDAIRCTVCHEDMVVNKAAYLAVGMDADGEHDQVASLTQRR